MSFLTIPLAALLDVVLMILNLYHTALIVYIIMGWLENFGIIDRYNTFVYSVQGFLARIIEPALMTIRRFVPSISGIDLSALVLLLFLSFVMRLLSRLVF